MGKNPCIEENLFKVENFRLKLKSRVERNFSIKKSTCKCFSYLRFSVLSMTYRTYKLYSGELEGRSCYRIMLMTYWIRLQRILMNYLEMPRIVSHVYEHSIPRKNQFIQ